MKNPLRIFALAALGSLLFPTAPTAHATPDTFSPTANNLGTARRSHTATVLPNGQVLVVGGFGNSGYLASAELYNPGTNIWTTSGAGTPTTPRASHTATLLPNGKVLVVGGSNNVGYLASAELYDPGTGIWTATAPLARARYGHTATLLPSGKVLIAGGEGASFNPGAEVYDPAGAGSWTDTGAVVAHHYQHTATLLPSGKVLVAGGRDSNTAGFLATAELYDPASNTWAATGALSTGARCRHTATLLPGGRVLVAAGQASGAGYLPTAELYDPVAGTWSATGSLSTTRVNHTATLLASGRVLVVGGSANGGSTGLTSAEIYDPASAGTWRGTGSLGGGRQEFTATLLSDGKVLVAAGNSGAPLNTAETYDPAIDVPWTATGPLTAGRQGHTATLMHSGLVLAAGGFGASGYLTSAELYDPVAGIWTATASLAAARAYFTATPLLNGKVLVVGGENDSGIVASAEIYDPSAGTWSPAGSLATAREQHSATLLADGKVLVAGGYGNAGPLASAELYDPAGNGGAGSWSPAGSLPSAHAAHTATLLISGKVLVTGGLDSGSSPSASAALYNPATDTWTTNTPSLTTGRYRHTATLLTSGNVLVVGGNGPGGLLASAQLFDPAGNAGAGSWGATGSLATGARANHSATLLPGGKVLIAGGNGVGGVLGSAELFDPAGNAGNGSWSATGSLATARRIHTATLLPSGRVLVAAGEPSGGGFLASAEFYDPATGGTWAATASMNTAHGGGHSSTLLANGNVLVAGGGGGGASAELYNPGTGTWSNTGSLTVPRYSHTATLLPNGKVLVAGGGGVGASAELYNPGTGMWSDTGHVVGRHQHTATLLPSGKVLVVGGWQTSGVSLATAELYDPASGTWSATGSLATARRIHTATLLPNGRVLVAGGTDGSTAFASAELYDPAGNGGAGSWIPTGSLATARYHHTATLLPTGKVLVVGENEVDAATAEFYDPVAGTWSPTGSLTVPYFLRSATLLPNGKVLVVGGPNTAYPFHTAELYDSAGNAGLGSWSVTGYFFASRESHTATLLPNGKVLVAGGESGPIAPLPTETAALYDVGQGFDPAWQPTISSATFDALGRLVLTGNLFRGLSSASGGNGSQDSPTSHPVVQLRRLDNEQSAFLLSDPATQVSATAFTSRPVADLRPGSVQVTVFTNGIPSPAVVVAIPQPDILVQQQPALFSIADGDTADFDTTVNGAPVSLTFTIKNTGALNLTGLTITRDGADVADYTVTASPTAPVAPDGTTTFTVRFLPTVGDSGLRNAAIHIASNVSGTKNPYDIGLAGVALSFTTDTDLDGMNDASEFLLSDLNFDWATAQPELVAKLFANANGIGLYTAAQVQTLNIGVPLIQKDAVTGKFKLTIGVQKTPNLETVPFTAFPFNTPGATTVINGSGKLEFEFTVPDNAAFFRLHAQ